MTGQPLAQQHGLARRWCVLPRKNPPCYQGRTLPVTKEESAVLPRKNPSRYQGRICRVTKEESAVLPRKNPPCYQRRILLVTKEEELCGSCLSLRAACLSPSCLPSAECIALSNGAWGGSSSSLQRFLSPGHNPLETIGNINIGMLQQRFSFETIGKMSVFCEGGNGDQPDSFPTDQLSMHVAPRGAGATPPVRMAKCSCRRPAPAALVASVQPSPAATPRRGAGGNPLETIGNMCVCCGGGPQSRWRWGWNLAVRTETGEHLESFSKLRASSYRWFQRILSWTCAGAPPPGTAGQMGRGRRARAFCRSASAF